MTENHEMQKTPSMSAPSTEPSKVESQDDTRMSRRKALLGALFAGAAITSKTAEASDANCSCLPAPDCNAVCPNGGSPRGDGTQACDCFENPPMPTLAQVAYTGKYADLLDKPRHAASDQENGDALNAKRWNGVELRKNYNSSATQILVFSGGYVDYINKSDISGQLPVIGAKVVTGSNTLSSDGRGNKTEKYPAVKRDEYGRVVEVGWHVHSYNCNCDCNCCDDNGCFVSARLRTTKGVKHVKDLRIGDRLIGIDGVHTIVGMVTNRLYGRKATSPISDATVVLTEDHVVIVNGKPVTQSEEMIERNKIVLTDDSNGVQGKYVWPFMNLQIQVSPESFENIEMPESTVTYTPIVEGGHWGMTESGTSVLLCRALED